MTIKLSLPLLGFTEDRGDEKMRKIEDLISKFQGLLVSMVRFWLFTKKYLLTDRQMGTESPVLENHSETSSEMASHSPLACDGGSGSGQPSATSQPAKRPHTRQGEANSTRPLSSWMAALRAGDRQSPPLSTHAHDTPPASARWHQATAFCPSPATRPPCTQ